MSTDASWLDAPEPDDPKPSEIVFALAAAESDCIRFHAGADTWDADLALDIHLGAAALRDAAAELVRAADRRLTTLVPEDEPLILDNGERIRLEPNTTRKAWQHDEIWRRVLARARDELRIDKTTGEVLEEPVDALARVIRLTMGFKWKPTGLRALGINPDDWCTVEHGHTVTIDTTDVIDRGEP